MDLLGVGKGEGGMGGGRCPLGLLQAVQLGVKADAGAGEGSLVSSYNLDHSSPPALGTPAPSPHSILQ